MGVSLQFTQLTGPQIDWYLDLILKNRSMFDEFLEFAEKKFVGENVRFLRMMTEIPWNGNQPVSPDINRGLDAAFIREGSFYQINVNAQLRQEVERAVKSNEAVDWGPIVMEIKKLLRHNKIVVQFLQHKEQLAQAKRA